MPDLSADDVLRLVTGRRGHFRMESGLHAGLWLELDALFSDYGRIRPLVDALARRIRPHSVAAVCGPLVGGAFLAQLVAQRLRLAFWYATPAAPSGEALYAARYALAPTFARGASGMPVAIVDDVISAGSSVRATRAVLAAAGARVPVAGALLVLGEVGAAHLAARGVALEAVARLPFDSWPPDACPLCAAGQPLEDVAPLPRP